MESERYMFAWLSLAVVLLVNMSSDVYVFHFTNEINPHLLISVLVIKT